MALCKWLEESLREPRDSHESMVNPCQLSHEIFKLLSGHVDKAYILLMST